ncbi:hypothetical protein EDC01DRAFT_189140 [Geopyxis carbonaria]|nr:hypothetical protein EDC01DRAFT_189140 [Geopyxis carbonaria]
MFGPEAWGKEALEVKRANLMGRPAHLHLEDDDPRILKILLDLLHLRSIPKLSDMTWEDLVQMAVLTDKYELRHTILQFVDYWTEPFGGTFRSTDNGAKKTELHKLGGWLLLSWTFGFPKIFEEVCQEIVVSCEKPISGVAALLMVEEDDDTGRKHEVNRYCMPQSLFDKLIGLREARIEKIRMHIQTLRDQLEPVKDHQPFCKKLADPHGWGDHSTYCKEKGGPEKCDLWQFAHLAKMNYAHDLSDEKTYDHSIRWFLRLAEKMRSSNYSTCSWVPALKQLCEEMATDKAGLKLSDYK